MSDPQMVYEHGEPTGHTSWGPDPKCGFCHDEPWNVGNAATWTGGKDEPVSCPRCGRSNRPPYEVVA